MQSCVTGLKKVDQLTSVHLHSCADPAKENAFCRKYRAGCSFDDASYNK